MRILLTMNRGSGLHPKRNSAVKLHCVPPRFHFGISLSFQDFLSTVFSVSNELIGTNVLHTLLHSYLEAGFLVPTTKGNSRVEKGQQQSANRNHGTFEDHVVNLVEPNVSFKALAELCNSESTSSQHKDRRKSEGLTPKSALHYVRRTTGVSCFTHRIGRI